VSGGQVITIAKWAMVLVRLDPVMGSLLTFYNLAASMGMIYHSVRVYGGSRWTLRRSVSLPCNTGACVEARRALGGLLTALAVLVVLLSYTAYHLSPLALNITL